MQKPSTIITFQLFIIFALSSFITSIRAAQEKPQPTERTILSQPPPSPHSIDSKPFEPHNHSINKLENNACELIPHFTENQERLLWQGTTFVHHTNLPQKVYCLLTDDDKLYLFANKNSLKKPLHLVDLSQYSFVAPVSKTPHPVTPSSVNPHNQKITQDNTVEFEHKDNPDMRHLLRCATHKYYYYDPQQDVLKPLCKDNIIDENHYLIQFSCQVSNDNGQNTHIYCLFPTNTHITYQQLCRLFERYLNTNVERLTRYGKKTDLTQNQSPTYWEDSKKERVYSITFSPQINYAPFPKNKLIKVKESTCPKLSHAVSSSDSLIKTCEIYEKMRKKDPFAQKKIDTEKVAQVSFTKEEYDHLKTSTHGHKPLCMHKGKCDAFRHIENKEQQTYDCTNNEYIHTLLFYHPRKRHIEISNPQHSPFIYQEDFASIHSLDMRKENPLRQLEDPRILLKQLLLEVIQNEAIKELVKDSKENSDVPILLDSDDESEEEDSDDESVESIEEVKNKIEVVKYPTSHELPWLKEVEEKMQCEQHKKLGSPLNIAEMCAIIMYTNTNCYIDLGKSQLNGEFEKWAIWDQLLIRAILKLHRVEKKINRTLYCGLAKVDVKVSEQKGFFKTYISTSKNRETGMIFLSNSGMLIHLSPEMQIQFPNCDISWISRMPDEEEILFARSADVGIFPAAQWQASSIGSKEVDNERIQHIRFRPIAQPLVVRKGRTLELPTAPFHIFSDIKIEENGTLTTEAWRPTDEKGGHLYLQCLGDCILEKNAKIDVSKKGYAGGTKQHPQGYGEGGGYGNRYCAAGGSHITQGSAAQCKHSFGKALYGFSFYFHAQLGRTYGKPIQTAEDLSLGSGGGSIQYYNQQENASGSPGGGALYLEVSGNLHVGKNARLLAHGGDAHSLSGGAGSGGSLCVQVKGKLICPNSSETHFAAQGGNNEQVCHPLAQGSGGNGNITLHIAQYEKILCFWFRTYPRNIFSISHTQLKDYTQLITALLLYPSPSFTTPTIKQLDLTSEIPHHVTIAAHYYNAKGKDYRKKAQYSKALAYHKKALQLQEEKYDNKAVHPVIAETYGYIGETLAAQGNYVEAIKAHEEELRVAQACYQKTNAAHPKLLKTYTHLSIAYHGQGQDTKAMYYLDNAIQVSEKANANKEKADVHDTRDLLHCSQDTEAMKYLKKAIQVSAKANDANKEIADVYDTRGLIHRSQANYNQAMQDHQKAADIRKQLYSQKAHSDSVISCKHIGQTHHAQGDNEKAIASYQDGLKMWQKLYPSQPDHPDGAAINVLLGEAYHSLGQYKQAITYQEKALISYNKTYAKQNHPDIADTLLRLGQSYDSQGDYNLATYHYQKAIQMLRTVYKQQDTSDEPFHPAIADALEQQGNAYLHFGNATKALQNHQEADVIRKHAYSKPAHPKRIESCNSIARYHLHQKQYEQALQILNKGIQAWKEQHSTQPHPIIALAYRLCGLVYYNQTEYASAREEHKVSLSLHKKLYGEKPHPAIADDHHAIADTYAKQKQYKGNDNSALFHYTKALEIRQKIYNDIPYHPSIAAALTAIGTTHAAIGESDQAIANHVQATRCQSQHFCKESQINHTLTSLYVHTNASRAKALEESVFPLDPRVQEFVRHPDNTVLLLHGDTGAGKSLYGRFLEHELWNTYQDNQSIIPLFISLPALKDPIHHAVTETLAQYGWDNATIQDLQKQSYHHYSQRTQAPEDDSKDDEKEEKKTDTQPTTPRLLIFFDEYNEINATQNLYETNQLAQWGAKVIIGCRTEYLDQLDNYRQYFQADTELYIRPFNTQQINIYLDRIDTTKQPNPTQTITWRKKQYKEKFEEMPSLKALSTSPFLLQLIVTVLPHLPNRTQITRADIYQNFITQRITAAINRMEQQGMGTIELEKCWEYARQVGLFMFLHERVTIQTSVNPIKENVSCDHFSDDEKECHYIGTPFFSEANTLLRKALPLKQLSKNTSSFLHQSIQEYCAAQALLQSVAQLSPLSPNELTPHFPKKVKPYNPITNKNTPALNQKLLNAAPAIIHFLVDELAPTAQYPAWKESLFAIIEASKKNTEVAIAAANSATILNAGGILLHDKDWANISIPHALLDHAFLARTNLQGANLMDVSLRQAYLEDAQLQKANLHNIHFGEYPTLPHLDNVNSVSWSPDGQRLASAGKYNSVWIWDGATGKLLQLCTGHTSWVQSVSWSPDGQRLASASEDKSVRIWDATTGKQLQLCAGHTRRVNSVSWSPDGKRLASASGGFEDDSDNSVRIWDATTGKQLQLCAGHTRRVNSVSWSPDSKRLASASGSTFGNDNSVRIWDGDTGKQLQLCDDHTKQVNSVHWSPDGQRLASASEDKSVRIWDAATGNQLQLCDDHTKQVNSVHWSPDGQHVVSASSDYSVRIWDVTTGKQLQLCTGHTSAVMSVSWSFDGKRLASASHDKSVRIWEVSTRNPLQQNTGHITFVNSVSWSPDGTHVAAASGLIVGIWNVATGEQLQQCKGHTSSVNSVSWSHDGKHLASASNDKSVRIWDVASGKQLQLCTGHTKRVNSVSWSHDGTRLASASDDKSVRIWDVASGKPLQLCTGHTSAINSVHWSHDGTHLASASDDKSVRIWDAATGKLLRQCTTVHTGEVKSVSWSHDGTRLASGSTDNSVWIWDAATGNPLQQCAGHTGDIMSVSWSPDGTRLASASGAYKLFGDSDNSVRIWNTATGKQLQQCTGHTSYVYSVSWSLDGKRLASASHDKSVRIWNPDNGKVLAIIGNRTFSLTLTDVNFTDTIGLSEAYKQLVQQRGGIMERKIEQLYKELLLDDTIDNTVVHKFHTWLFDHEMDSDALHWDCGDASSSNVNAYNTAIYNKIRSLGKQQWNNTKINANFLHAVKSGQLTIDELLTQRSTNINTKDKDNNNALHNACLYSGSVAMVTWLLDGCKIPIETRRKNQKMLFLSAAEKGQLKIAKLLKERGANIHAIDENGDNALHKACLYSGSVAMVTWLLDVCKIGIETKGFEQRTPFLFAAENGQLDIAKLLKERGANIHAKNEKGNNALHLACLHSGSEEMVTWLLDVCKLGIETKGYEQKTPFLFAAEKGQLEIAKLLKQRGASVNAKDEYGSNALHFASLYSGSVDMVNWLLDVCKIGIETKGYGQKTPFLSAAEKGQLAIAKLLKKRGADIIAKDENRNNALHLACLWSESEEMVTWLLGICNIDIETKGQYQYTPFLCAAQKSQLKIARLLKKRGANINAKDSFEYNALHEACLSGSVKMTKWLLDECKIDIEAKGEYERTPFLCASEKGQLAIAKLLRKRGANINAKTANGSNALHWACYSSVNVEMATWLLDKCKIGIETKGNGQITPFLCAASTGQLAIVKLLKERGANIHAANEHGNNALHTACLSGNVEMTTWLLAECKIDIETEGYAKMTPFLCAVEGRQLKIAKLLRQRGANIHATDKDGSNALHFACRLGSVDMVTWLLDVCNIDIESKGNGQRTPFLFAVERGQLGIAKLLKQRGANIHAKDEYGNNALHWACLYSGSVAMVTWLLDVCKIDIETKGQYQKTPFLFAAEKGQLEIAKLLKQRGASVNAKDEYGSNALHFASLYSGSVDMVNWLLDVCKIGIETKGYGQKTPFLSAAEKGQLAIAKLLKKRGADIIAKDENRNNALHLTCLWSESEEMVTWLLGICNIDIETKGQYQYTPFLCAAQKSQLKIARLLKKRGANINAKDSFEYNALHEACLSGSVKMTKWLLDECKIDIEAKGEYERTPFLCASEKGQLAIAKLLRKRGANINAKTANGSNALHWACYSSVNVEMATWLLDKCKIGIETKGNGQITPFICAASTGQLAIVKLLKQRGANIHARDEDGNNALHTACLSGNVEMTTWLLAECKIDIETEGYAKMTPFLCAVEGRQLKIAKLLRQRGANIHATDKDGDNALHAARYSGSVEMINWLIETKEEYPRHPFLFAAENGQMELAKLLKKGGTHIHATDKDGSNALHYACRLGSVDMVTWLLDECNIPIETKGFAQITPFLFAAAGGRLEIAKLLNQRGANINAKGKDGNNALHFAGYFSDSVAMVTWLLDVCKIDLETKGQYQKTPFLCAASTGQLEVAKRLKQRGAKINAKGKDGNNALHFACYSSDSVAMVTWLLDVCKIPLETKGFAQKTPFLCAAENGQLEIAKLLKKRGANINEKDKDGDNTLHIACLGSGSVPMVTWLLDVCNIPIETKGNAQKTPFLYAAKNGQLEIAKLLKERGANIHATDKDGDNALHAACDSGSVDMITWLIETKEEYPRHPFLFAAENGQMELAKLLKEQGADINAEDSSGNNALHVACLYSGSVAMVEWLLDVCKIDIEAKEYLSQRTPFLFAAEKGKLKVAKLLRKRDANINAKTVNGNNALHQACLFSGSEAMVKWLLDVCKIGIEAKGEYERTPFLCAVEKGQLAIAKLLKERGANINAKSNTGNNALHDACLSGSVEMVTWLLDECKISIETKGVGQKTPFICTAQKGQLAIAKLLKDRGANINATNKYGDNALHEACLSGSVDMIPWLLDVCKIGIEAKGCHQQTPFLCAVEKGQLAIAKLLKERGANIHAIDENGDNALHKACLYSGSVAMVTWLLDVCKIGLETKGRFQYTPFICAAAKGQVEIAKLLKQRGANINAKDEYENSALHDACLSGSVDMIPWLLDVCKIGIEAKGCHQQTPFLCAVEKGQLAIAKLLKERGANIHAIDENGDNALHYACLFSGSVPMVTWLLDVCKLDIETKVGWFERTPFLDAVEKGKLPIAKLLKKRGANIHAKDNDGDNALHLAWKNGSVEMITWLLDECKINIETKVGRFERTPFLDAVEKGKLPIAKRLKERGANIHAKNKYGANALHLACLFSGSVEMVTWLLDVCKLGIETKGYKDRTPFLDAAIEGQLAIAKLLKQRGANIHAEDKDGDNALHYACLFSGSVPMVTWLLDVCKLDIETKGYKDRTPFLDAAIEGQLAIAKLLKQRGANVNAKTNTGNNALHAACLYSDSVAMVTWLLDVCKIGIETKGQYQKTPFLYAAEKGQLPIAKLLRQRGANINAKDKDGKNALHFAYLSGSVEMITWLIETRGEYPRDPFLFAAKNEKLEIAKLLKQRGANIHAEDKDGDNALHYACLFSGSVPMVTWLLDVCKLDIETKGYEDRTPFLDAAIEGQLAIAKLLKQRGANVNAKTNTGNNALHLASLFSSNVAMINWLLDECKIDLETKGNGQKTPFLCAASKGKLAIAKLLRQRGANIHAEDKYGDNALHRACLSGSEAMVTWLLDVCKLDIETKGYEDRTPFLYAAQGGKLNIAKLLKQRGANIHKTNWIGDNALHFACKNGSVEMITWLLDECKINIETKVGWFERTPFLDAVEKGKLPIAKLLKKRGANIHAKGAYGKNALHFACKNGSVEMITWLLDECKINIETKVGWFERTPFLDAVEKGKLPIAKRLKERGANINATDSLELNALHLACLFSGSVEMITWLLDECKIGIETKGFEQRTPFLCAAIEGQLAIAKLLKERGANIHKTNWIGDNALQFACLSGSVEMVTWLLDECKMGLETKGWNEKTPFLFAANNGHLKIAKLLKERGANIHKTNRIGDNALHFACLSGSVEMVTWLLDECKMGLETKGWNERTPFLDAVEKGKLPIAKLLKERGANIHKTNWIGDNALHFACLSGSVEMVTWLLDECKMGLETKGQYQKTPFLYAAEKGQLPIAKLLRQRGANINAKDKDGKNALHFAYLSGSVEMITWLIETRGEYPRDPFLFAAKNEKLEIAKLLRQQGADIHAKDEYGNNALHLACLSGNEAMVKWLLDECKLGIETKGNGQKTPFLSAVEHERLKIAKLLKQRGTNINAKDVYGRNALHFACAVSGSEEMVTWLLDVCKIGIETKGQHQKTPFLSAAEEGQLEIAKLLKQRGANIHARDKYGDNALHMACLCSGSPPMVAWLLDVCKMGLETKGFAQKTPFLCAAQNGHLKIAKLLKERGANVNAKTNTGNNALHAACLYSDSVAMVTWLLDVCKIGIETKGQYQKTPFLYAAEKGQLPIAKLLRQRGANINAKDKDGKNALHFAYLSGSVEMITWLIETRGEYPRDPFLFAAKNEKLEIAKLLRQQGADIHAKDEYGNNALHLACLSGNEAMVKWLLDECKLGIETKGNGQKTPFLSAVEHERLKIAKLLKQRGTNINAKDVYGRNALHFACAVSGSEEMVTWLLDVCKIGIETKGQHQKTPFLSAAEEGQLEIAKLLKERGANIHARDKYGDNALHMACLCSGSPPMVAWLLDVCKMGLETKGFAQKTPFLCAAQNGQLAIAKLLKERGANIKEEDKWGGNALYLARLSSRSVPMVTWLLDECKMGLETKGFAQKTPFLFAAQEGQLAIAKLLKQRGADIKEENKWGGNALHEACLESESVEMVTWLLDECKLGIETKGFAKRTPFLCAAKKGQLEIAKLLRQRGANVNAKEEDGNNALHLACLWSKSVPMVTWLLDVCKIDIETKGEYEKTPFLLAVRRGELAIAKLLKQRGANVNAKTNTGNNALHLASLFSSNVAMINWLLDECKIDLETKGNGQQTPFLCAASKGKLAIAKLLRQRGANIHAEDKYGDNALHYACLFSGSVPMVTWLLDVCKLDIETKVGWFERTPFLDAVEKGKLPIAKLLKKRGANIHAKGAYGKNALHLAWKNGSVEMITWLLDECKINIETKVGWFERTPFLDAAIEGQLAIAKLLKQRGANVNAKTNTGNNALHLASLFSSNVAMINWLLDECKIDLETKGNGQKTPFLCAASKGKLAIAKLLKERGANINATDSLERNALYLACLFSGSVEMITWLLDECKIGIETKGFEQRTPFLRAAQKGQLAIAKLLKERGANIHAKDIDGDNALHLAWKNGSVEMITWLLDECKINIETKVGWFERTPFISAAIKGHLEIAKLLKERGANIHAKDYYGRNALHFACLYSSSVDMITWLLDVCKLDIETKGYEDRTPFLYAAQGGKLNIAKLLKERGANIHAKNENGNNALHFACLFSSSVDMITWLLDVCKLALETKGYAQRTPFLCAAQNGNLDILKVLEAYKADINAEDEDGNNALHLAKWYSKNQIISYLQSLGVE